jgi:hypothetical protein
MSVDATTSAQLALVPTRKVILPRTDLIAAVGHSTIGFMRHNGNEPPTCLGTGTLIEYGKVFGVLTCAHALGAIREAKEVGFLCFTVRGKVPQDKPFNPKILDAVSLGREPWSLRGPDLAFVRIPANAEGHFRALSTPRNLQRHRELMVSGISRNFACYAVAGVVDEWTKLGTPRANRRTMSYSAFASLGNLRRYVEGTDGHDKWIYEPKQLPPTPLPKSYEGTSGGGLWRVEVLSDGSGRNLQVVLAGVAVMQTRRGKIVCHGAHSIYGKLVAAMKAAWRSDCPQEEN